MKLKLAQKLKDEGFPQEGSPDSIECTICNECSCCCENWKEHEHCYVKFPNLDELIEECGSSFESLARVGDKWVARGYNYNNFEDNPLEAVANLWLINNKK